MHDLSMSDCFARKIGVETQTINSVSDFLSLSYLLLLRLLLLRVLLSECPLFGKVLLLLNCLENIEELDIFRVIRADPLGLHLLILLFIMLVMRGVGRARPNIMNAGLNV